MQEDEKRKGHLIIVCLGADVPHELLRTYQKLKSGLLHLNVLNLRDHVACQSQHCLDIEVYFLFIFSVILVDLLASRDDPLCNLHAVAENTRLKADSLVLWCDRAKTSKALDALGQHP